MFTVRICVVYILLACDFDKSTSDVQFIHHSRTLDEFGIYKIALLNKAACLFTLFIRSFSFCVHLN